MAVAAPCILLEIMNSKPIKKEILLISLLSLVVIVVASLLLFPMVKMALHLDFSQEYRKVEGADRIRFRDNWSGKVYSRSFWGLRPVGEVEEIYDTQNSVSQPVISPDGRYLLFCEIEYGMNGGYSTDEEYCYYRVIDRENGEQYTIYSGYREWYQVYWAD